MPKYLFIFIIYINYLNFRRTKILLCTKWILIIFINSLKEFNLFLTFMVELSVIFNILLLKNTKIWSISFLEISFVAFYTVKHPLIRWDFFTVMSKSIDKYAFWNILDVIKNQHEIEFVLVNIKLNSIFNMWANITKLFSTKLVVKDIVEGSSS